MREHELSPGKEWLTLSRVIISYFGQITLKYQLSTMYNTYLHNFQKLLTILDVSSVSTLLRKILIYEFAVTKGLETKKIMKQNLGSPHFSAVEELCRLHSKVVLKCVNHLVSW